MDPAVDAYIARSEKWPEELVALRSVLLEVGLTEQIKWGKPCYSDAGANIAILQEMKGFLALMFFKGALLQDPDGLLESQGPNSRSARRLCFTSTDDVSTHRAAVAAYIAEAVDVERAGLEVGPPPETVFVAELQQRLDSDPAFSAAFFALTPGRRREYNIHISGAKKAATREARVAKFSEKILSGKGLRD